MAFDDIERRRIENTVGAMCRRRSPPQFNDKLRVAHVIEAHSVLVYATPLRRDDLRERTKTGVAKLRYIRSRKLSKLYSTRADLKRHAYDPEIKAKSLEAPARVVDQDRYGAYFG